MAGLPVFEGDTLLLYCPEATGHLYCEPLSSASNLLTVFTSRDEKPHFPNIDFATFRISHGKLPKERQMHGKQKDPRSVPISINESEIKLQLEPMTIVYGSTIKLQHQASGKYLSITPTNSAWLDDGKSETSLFQLVPPHQEKGWGEDLTLDDSVKLESTYYKGYRIQCVNNPLEANYHLVLAVTGSIFHIRSHCHKRVTLSPQAVMGGSAIMLSSLKIEGYISGRGSFVKAKLPEQFGHSQNELGLRRWRPGFFKILPFSGDTFLQFEKVSLTSTGDPFFFGEECRIKHLLTQQYISVKKASQRLEVVIQELKEADGFEIFKILSAGRNAQQTEVHFSSQIALQHVKSQKLLSVNVRPVLKNVQTSQRDHLSQWFKLVLDDYDKGLLESSLFGILKIESDAILDIYHVTGLSSSLCGYLKKFNLLLKDDSVHYDAKIVSQLENLFQGVASQMKGLQSLFSTTSNKKRLANMLRTFQAIDVMIAILMKMAASSIDEEMKHHACSVICSSLEMYIENGNVKSRHYLAKRDLLNSLMQTVGRGFGTEKVLIALSQDDAKIGDLMQEFLIALIETLNTEDPEVAELMTTLAFSGRFNKQIQDKIYERTLETGMVHNHHANSDVRRVLESFVKTVGVYLEKIGVTISRQWKTYDYINFTLESTENGSPAFSEQQWAQIQTMKEGISQYLSRNEMHVIYAGDDFKGRNSILAQILGVLVFLIDYGTYAKGNEGPRIIDTLIRILDGSIDEGIAGESFQCHERYNIHSFSGNKIVFKIKKLALQCLQLFLKQRFNASVRALLYDFKFLRGKGDELYSPTLVENDEECISEKDIDVSLEETIHMTTEENELRYHHKRAIESQEDFPPDLIIPPVVTDVATQEVIELTEVAIHSKNANANKTIPLFVPPPQEMKILLDKEERITTLLSQVSHARLRYNFRSELFPMFDVDTVECQRLCNVLLDLINYEDTDVRLMSAELLFDIYNVERIMLCDAKEAYFITCYTDQIACQEMKSVAAMTDEDQLLSKMLRKQIQDVPKLLSKLTEISKLCVSIDDETEPNSSNQSVAYSCGLFNVLLEYVLEYGPSDDYDQEEVLRACFDVLTKIARKNKRAQDKLFANFNDFLEVKIAIAPMTCLLNEIFSNNSILCKKLSEADIKKMFYTAVGSSSPEHYELTVTLRTILKSTEPATPVQEYIVQLILDCWQDNLGHLLDQKSQSFRFDLLRKAKDEDPELNLLLNIEDLLGSCATGECQFAESVSRQFFTLDELLLVLNDEEVVIHRKLPSARILTWTYLNTERDSALACSQLASSRNFWSHMEKLIYLIDEQLFTQIASISIDQKRVLQSTVKFLSKMNWSLNQWMSYSSHLNDLATSRTNINGMLLYVIEGAIPLLSGFCYEMFLHLSGGNEICIDILTSKEIAIVKGLAEKLMLLHHRKIISASEQIKNLRQCVDNIKSLCDSIGNPVDFSLTSLSVLSSLGSRGRAISTAGGLDQGNPEMALNQDLQTYIEKYSVAQINDVTVSSDHTQESLTIPKGPSFERLIELFTDDNEDLRQLTGVLKVNKLVLILRTLIQKQKHQEKLRSLERANLETITLTTLQLLCGIIFNRIIKVPRGDLQPEEFQQQYEETIQPIQKLLLDSGIVEMLIGLLHHPRDDIAFQVLACLNVLLYPGNEDAQRRITYHVSQQDHSLFLRVHQILRGAQSSFNKAKMGNALAQIAALISDPIEDDVKEPLSVRLLERNKSAVFSLDDLSQYESQVQLSNRRRTAAIESSDGGQNPEFGKFSVMNSEILGSIAKRHSGVEIVDYRITMALNVLSWLCDGQQKDMQDLLRDDKTFSGSNIVSQVTFLLYGIAEHLNEANIPVAQGAVQALIEMCAGNYNNQLIAFKGQVIISADTILQEDISSVTAIGPLRKLKSSCIELMEVMLEETDEKSSVLANWIISQWDMSTFLGAMFDLWSTYSQPFNISSREQLRNSIFRAYHVLRRIADYKGTSVDKLVEYRKDSKAQSVTKFDAIFEDNVDDAKSMWQYCQLWSRSIEVVYKAKSGKEILTRAYFPYDPHKHLNETEKDTILLHVKRNTPQEKLSDLLQWTQAIRAAHEWKKKVKKSWKTYWLLWASTIRHFILFWLTIILNSIVLFALKIPSDYGVCPINDTCNSTSQLYFQPIPNPDSPRWYHPVLYTLGSIHLILAIWMVLQYYAKHWANIRFEIPFIKKTIYNAKKGLLRRKYIYQFFRLLNKVFCCGRLSSSRPQPEKYFQIFFFSFEPLYRIIFLCCSILALGTNGYFYCCCMIYLFLRNHVLLYVLRAVRKSALQLITIFILGLVVMYIYAVISFALIPNYFPQDRDQFCDTIFQCFVTITRLGLLDTLGSAIDIRPSNELYQPNFTIVGLRTLYDIIFLIVVTTLGLNIIIAILVDRFSDLREEKDKIDDDNDTRCFICSLKKDVFERNGLNFQKHWQAEHNLWNYIHFILYLDTLHPNDHNALEKSVSQQVPSKNNPAGFIDFFPMFRAKCLPDLDINKEWQEKETSGSNDE